MGDRGVICFEEAYDDKKFGKICIYSHWSGSKLPIITQGVMKTSQNINNIERLGVDILVELEYGSRKPDIIAPLIDYLKETEGMDNVAIASEKPLIMTGKLVNNFSDIDTKVELFQQCYFGKGMIKECDRTVKVINNYGNKIIFEGTYDEFLNKKLEE